MRGLLLGGFIGLCIVSGHPWVAVGFVLGMALMGAWKKANK